MMRSAIVLVVLTSLAIADRAVTLDGTVIEKGNFDASKMVFRASAKKEVALARLGLVETDAGKHLYSPNFETRERAYAHLTRAEQKRIAVSVLEDAIKSLDQKLARRTFELAQRNGYGGKAAEKFKRRLEKFEKKTIRSKPNKGKVERVQKALADLADVESRLLIVRVQANLESDRRGALALLRRVLQASPKHADGQRILNEVYAKDFPLKDPMLWLNWHLDLDSTGAKLVVEGSRELARFRARWRKDLVEIDLGPIRLLTPVRDTRVIGRCLAWGGLTAKALQELFKGYKPLKRRAKAMTILLYASRKEYKTTSGTGMSIVDPESLEWSSGHYSPREQVSRFYWKPGRDAERRMAGTFVHELTHHWIEELNPAFADSQRRSSGDLPGHWVIEGFARFMQEGRYDVERGTWNLFDARAKSLDTVLALKGKGDLIPWEQLVGLTSRHNMVLSRKDEIKVVRRGAMGSRLTAKRRLVYDQGAAICHYLYHADGGKHRKALLDYVVHQYTGKADKLTSKAAFGVDAATLGAAVEKFALDVSKGWRPTGS